MRIQTRLFVGTGALVLALMGTQWWLHQRQLEGLESELTAVATSVGKDMLSKVPDVRVRRITEQPGELEWISEQELDVEIDGSPVQHDVHVIVVPEGADAEVTRRITRRWVHPPDGSIEDGAVQMRVETEMLVEGGNEILENDAGTGVDPNGDRRFVLKVERIDESDDRMLVISGDQGQLQRIPIPVQPAVEAYRATMQRGAAFGGVLLVVGLVGAAVLANRVSRPLRDLAAGAHALGEGERGVQVPVTATGEVGALQRSFNQMSERLAALETEREQWLRREHLAQLGDLSRGLAHTLRNPLNTLGLAVEELASGSGDQTDLVATSRFQIRRIDQWLRSFLALGAESAADPEDDDLSDLARAVVLESIQQGARIELEDPSDATPVRVVGTAVRAAVANLLDNASEASPAGVPVEVSVRRDGASAVVTVSDRGPGLPDEVRRRLYEPHVTTKVGGSGMGLFLAQQLIVGMHGGTLDVDNRPGGGTIAVVTLPIVDREATDRG
jgi:signal transduction histidine kinase